MHKYPANKCFFTADLHFGSQSVLRHCNRNFDTVQEMNEFYINNWNQTIKNNDFIFILGDLVHNQTKSYWRNLITKLNGKKILIIGNHDKEKSICLDYFEYVTKQDSFFFSDKKNTYEIFMCHYPCINWPNQYRNAWHIFGHCHGKLDTSKLSKYQMDVGIDVENKIFSFDDLKNKFI